MEMKTIQEYLKQAERSRLVDLYIERYHPVDYEHAEKYADMTLSEIREMSRKKIGEYVDHLCSLTIDKSEKSSRCILYARRDIKKEFPEIEVEMMDMEELVQIGIENAKDYAYYYTPQAEIMGFVVADTPLTQQYIYEVMASVMYEASWFGYKNEQLEVETRKLEIATENALNFKEKNCVDDIFKEFNIKPSENDCLEAPEEIELRNKARDLVYEYGICSRNKERRLILQSIQKNHDE